MIPVFVRSEKAANTNAIVFGVTLPWFFGVTLPWFFGVTLPWFETEIYQTRGEQSPNDLFSEIYSKKTINVCSYSA
jgi:hypothetical protein